MNDETRKRRLARIHIVAASVGLKGDAYRRWLKRRTGVTSCKDLTDSQLDALVNSLKATRPQWRKIGRLCQEIGWTGFEDPGFRTFVKRITEEDEPNLLSKPELGHVIVGLQSWIENRRKRDELSSTPNGTAP